MIHTLKIQKSNTGLTILSVGLTGKHWSRVRTLLGSPKTCSCNAEEDLSKLRCVYVQTLEAEPMKVKFKSNTHAGNVKVQLLEWGDVPLLWGGLETADP